MTLAILIKKEIVRVMCVGDVDVNVAAGSAHERGIEVLNCGAKKVCRV